MEVQRGKKYTYADYLTWNDENRYELIDGVPYLLASPSYTHQRIFRGLFRQLANYLDGKGCEVLSAPFDVRLDADAGDNTAVLPDIFVVCDRKKIEERGCKGAPDMAIEILSPSTASRDQVLKFDKYLKSGVREYWMVYPESKTVQVYLLKNGEYIGKNYDDTATVSVNILDGCQINLTDVFRSEEDEA